MATSSSFNNTERLARGFESLQAVESVPQVLVDAAILTDRTLRIDLSREKLTVIGPLNETSEYNFYVREAVLDWLAMVISFNKMSIETFALTIRLFDISMQHLHGIKQNMVQLVCAAALLMSSKMLDTSFLTISKIVEFCGSAYNEDYVVNMERYILEALRRAYDGIPDIYGVTPHDIIVPLAHGVCDPNHFPLVRMKANIFYGILASKPVFYGQLPSIVAGALVYRAHHTLITSSSELLKIRRKIVYATEVSDDILDNMLDHFEQAYIKWIHDNAGNESQVHLPVCFKESGEGTPTDVFTSSQLIDLLTR